MTGPIVRAVLTCLAIAAVGGWLAVQALDALLRSIGL